MIGLIAEKFIIYMNIIEKIAKYSKNLGFIILLVN